MIERGGTVKTTIGIIAAVLVVTSVIAQERSAALPEPGKVTAMGLRMECSPSKTEYAVGDFVSIACTVTNDSGGIKPLPWNINTGNHFVLAASGRPGSGIAPRAFPDIRKPLTIKSGYPTTEYVLFLPPGETLTFELHVGKAERVLDFRGRIEYDILPIRGGKIQLKDGEFGDEFFVVSNVFAYKVLPAGEVKQ